MANNAQLPNTCLTLWIRVSLITPTVWYLLCHMTLVIAVICKLPPELWWSPNSHQMLGSNICFDENQQLGRTKRVQSYKWELSSGLNPLEFVSFTILQYINSLWSLSRSSLNEVKWAKFLKRLKEVTGYKAWIMLERDDAVYLNQCRNRSADDETGLWPVAGSRHTAIMWCSGRVTTW